MRKLIKTNFYYLLILFVLAINFNIFEKVYLIYLNDYNKRLETAYGDCNKEGYKFVKTNISDEILKSNFFIKNKYDYPSIKGFFYNFNTYGKNKNQNYLFLINYKEDFIKKNYFTDYKLLKKKGDCFLLKKND